MAMETIFKNHWETVFDATFKRTGNEVVAQDITQEIFISLWENRENLNIEQSLSAYLYGAVKFKVINYYRSISIRNGHQNEFVSLMNADSGIATDSKLLVKELNLEVESAIARLPEKMRIVISMSRKEEKSIKEIADALDISVQTVKNHITAAMKVLRKNLSYILLLAILLLLTEN